MVARLVWDQEVESSNLSAPTYLAAPIRRAYSQTWFSSRWNSSRLANGITIRPAPRLLA